MKFFATAAGAAFRGFDYPILFDELVDSGSGDPLRWSVIRVERALRESLYGGYVQLETALSAPHLLRAFIPFAHAQSGIRDELTAQALAAVDEDAPRYRSRVLREAANHGYFDDEAG